MKANRNPNTKIIIILFAYTHRGDEVDEFFDIGGYGSGGQTGGQGGYGSSQGGYGSSQGGYGGRGGDGGGYSSGGAGGNMTGSMGGGQSGGYKTSNGSGAGRVLLVAVVYHSTILGNGYKGN